MPMIPACAMLARSMDPEPPQTTLSATGGPPLLRHLRRGTLGLLVILLLATIGILTWARLITPADPAARRALDSDDSIIVSRGDWISFRSRDSEAAVGVVVYPAARAEPAAYAPMLRRLAVDGYFVVLTPMPLNLAFLAPDSARRVMAQHPEISRWVLIGHDLGGKVAAWFAGRHPGEVTGLVLWAASPPPGVNLSREPWPVLSIGGSADTITPPDNLLAGRSRLPPTTRYVEIPGADHWSFGNFEPAVPAAARPREEEQQAAILDATEALLAGIDTGREDASPTLLQSPAPVR